MLGGFYFGLGGALADSSASWVGAVSYLELLTNERRRIAWQLLQRFDTVTLFNIGTCATAYNNRDAVDSFLLRHSNFVIADTLKL
jgi:hypothetical protein